MRYRDVKQTPAWGQLGVSEKRFIRANQDNQAPSVKARVKLLLARAARKAVAAVLVRRHTNNDNSLMSTAADLEPLTITLNARPVTVRIQTATQVELCGELPAPLSGQPLPYVLVLQKVFPPGRPAWRVVVGPPKLDFTAEAIAFSEWAAAHPRLFALTDLLARKRSPANQI